MFILKYSNLIKNNNIIIIIYLFRSLGEMIMENNDEKFIVTKRAGILGMARKCFFVNY